jgi:pSer/pThr/pTyr-binding forkhead associated (FHA) protein
VFRLVVISGPGIGTQLKLSHQTVVEIGRSPTADLTLNDPHVADLHLKLYREGNGFVCFDVTGAGFGHNRQRVLKAQLAVGDVIQVGSHAIRLIADRPDMVPRVDPTQVMRAPPGAAGRALLRSIRGNDAGKTFPLGDKPVVIIGRGVSTDITLWDIRASRAHARIDRQGNAYRISDLNSSNGTFVNGQRITTHHLQAGDMIKIGTSVLQFSPEG